ncbi:MAG: Mur ligase family protein, partial [Acidimicrobiales bacterium]
MTTLPGEVVCSAAALLAGLRWLRVAQREHYLPRSVTRFARRWWTASSTNIVLGLVAVAGTVAAFVWPLSAIATGLAVGAGPVGLSVRGRSSGLAWTRRLRTLAGLWLAMEAALITVGVLGGAGAGVVALACLIVPLAVDVACALTAPLERGLSARHVTSARRRLDQVRPTVVAITGSYGKTSTKNYLSHLLGGTKAVVSSPASFNNRAGLARTVNESLVTGTEVLVAEMGTYRRGEIADLCSWLRPEIAVITSIGPVHLERLGTQEAILEAKSEILITASTVVLNIDDDRLSALAEGLADGVADGSGHQRLVRCSALDRDADVSCVAA